MTKVMFVVAGEIYCCLDGLVGWGREEDWHVLHWLGGMWELLYDCDVGCCFTV